MRCFRRNEFAVAIRKFITTEQTTTPRTNRRKSQAMSLRWLVMLPVVIIPIAAQGASLSSALAMQGSFGGPQVPSAGQFFRTRRGTGVVTGRVGSMATTTVPGSGGQGLLMNNGNGTSTLIVPGGAPQVVVTPR
jgi:hypothetical protein